MKKNIILMMLFLLSCSLIEIKNSSRIKKIEYLISRKSKIKDFKELFKENIIEEGNSIRIGSNENASHLFANFNKLGVVSDIIMWVYPSSLEKYLSEIKCNWKHSEEYKSFHGGHEIKLIKKGNCLDRKISYNYIVKGSYYEVKWLK